MRSFNKRLVISITFFLLALLVPVTVLSFLSHEIDITPSAKVYHLAEDWYENGEPFTGRTVEPGQEIVLTWQIPDDKTILYPALNLNTEYCAMEFYLDGECIFSYSGKEEARTSVVPKTPIYVPLPTDSYGKTLTLHIYPSLENTFSCSSYYYGNIEDVGNYYYENRRLALFVGVFLLVFGLFLSVTIPFIRPIYTHSKSILFHGPLLVDLGIYFLCYNQVFYVLVPNLVLNNYAEHVSLYLIPLLLQCTIIQRNKQSDVLGNLFIAVDMVFVALSVILSLMGVIFIKDALYIGHGLIVIQGIFTIIQFIHQFKEYQSTTQDQYLYNGRMGLNLILAGATILILSAFMEMVIWYVPFMFGVRIDMVVRGAFLMVGSIILAACMIASYFFYTIASINDKNIQNALEGLAYNDELTEVSNRAYCEQQMELLTRLQKQCIVISLDMDGLKGVNDSIGHVAGDDMIQHFSRMLKEAFTDSLLIGRMGEMSLW